MNRPWLLLLSLWPLHLLAQGGPPLLTDDPGTPGAGRWEINIALTFEGEGDARSLEAPLLDINYGLGESIQLKYEQPWMIADDKSGLGHATVGVKWRFIDEAAHGYAASVYPQLEFNNPILPAKRELVDEGTTWLFPLEIAKAFGRLEASAEAGYAFRRGERDGVVYGLALGLEPAPGWELLAEIHGHALADTGVVLNLGLRRELGPWTVLAAAGGGLSGEAPDVLGYFGLQWRNR